ncbi:MAG: hypothetical protein U0031_11520 [Thermomicrobiales bacterium]
MDRERFDALTNLFASRGTRRMVLATIGAALLRPDLETARARTVRGHASERTTATATTGAVCYPGTRCTPGKGRNASRCDFAYSTYLKDRDARGANLSRRISSPPTCPGLICAGPT